jgi:uncharacterized membrane protein YheB (UPF0754 family)
LDENILARTIVTIVFAAVAGGVTNTVAVWMLFHPYEPPRLFRWRLRMLQGAIPKNKARLAVAMGRTVGLKLLTPEDLQRTLAEPGFREAFDARLSAFLATLLDERRPSLNELLPPALAAEIRGVLAEVSASGVRRLDGWLASEEFTTTARRWAASLADEVRDRPLSELLTAEREAELAAAAERWIIELVGGDGFARAVEEYIDRGAERLLAPGRTFQELLPQGLVGALERAIAGYLPVALERLGGLLEEPGARERLERILHELLDRFMRDLKFHQRLVAALLITPETIDRVIRAIEAEGAAKISELLHDSDVRDAMARGVNDAVVEFLRKPVVDVLGRADEPTVMDAKQTVRGWVLQLARDPQTRGFLIERLRGMLDAAERRTWGDVFEHVPPERFADALVTAARSERAAAAYRDAADAIANGIMHRPIGRPADHLPADAPARIERAVADPLWRWIQEQVPVVVQRLDITRRVEQKILEFPTRQLELLILGVVERELRLIVRLGYVLGAVIGFTSAMIALLF